MGASSRFENRVDHPGWQGIDADIYVELPSSEKLLKKWDLKAFRLGYKYMDYLESQYRWYVDPDRSFA